MQPSDNYRRSHWHPSCSSFARPFFACLPCHNLVFLLEGTDSQKVKEEVRSPTDPFQHVLELSTHCCPRKQSGKPRACLLGCSVRAQAARKYTHRINVRAQPPPSHPHQVSGLFQSPSTPINTNLEKASSYILLCIFRRHLQQDKYTN